MDARELAEQVHGDQKYGSQPYTVHLDAVWAVLQEAGAGQEFYTPAYLHDILEDTPLTASQLFDEYWVSQLDIEAVQFCTDSPGVNREDRKAKTYARVQTLLQQPSEGVLRGVAVKLADRIANIRASNKGLSGSVYVHELNAYQKMYAQEMDAFRKAYTPEPVFQTPLIQTLLNMLP